MTTFKARARQVVTEFCKSRTFKKASLLPLMFISVLITAVCGLGLFGGLILISKAFMSGKIALGVFECIVYLFLPCMIYLGGAAFNALFEVFDDL